MLPEQRANKALKVKPEPKEIQVLKAIQANKVRKVHQACKV